MRGAARKAARAMMEDMVGDGLGRGGGGQLRCGVRRTAASRWSDVECECRGPPSHSPGCVTEGRHAAMPQTAWGPGQRRDLDDEVYAPLSPLSHTLASISSFHPPGPGAAAAARSPPLPPPSQSIHSLAVALSRRRRRHPRPLALRPAAPLRPPSQVMLLVGRPAPPATSTPWP